MRAVLPTITRFRELRLIQQWLETGFDPKTERAPEIDGGSTIVIGSALS
jgi:hypothetical protein